MQNEEKIDLKDLEFHELESFLKELGEPKFRAKQIFDWLHVKKVTDFEQMSNLSAQFRAELSEKFCINRLKIKKRLVSKIELLI